MVVLYLLSTRNTADFMPVSVPGFTCSPKPPPRTVVISWQVCSSLISEHCEMTVQTSHVDAGFLLLSSTVGYRPPI